MAAANRPNGELQILYRGATKTERNMQLLNVADSKKSLPVKVLESWKFNACPVSTASMTATIDGNFYAWESRQKIYYHLPGASAPRELQQQPQPTRQKYPTVAMNEHKDYLIAWGTGVGWHKSGKLFFRLFNQKGRLVAHENTAPLVIPDHSMPAVAALSTNNFVLIF